MKTRNHKDPVTKLYHCAGCFKAFTTASSRQRHFKNSCKVLNMSGKKSSPSDKSPATVAKQLVQNYANAKKDGLTEEQIRNMIARSVELSQLSGIRAYYEKEMQEDANRIKMLSDSVRRNMLEPWAFKARLLVEEDFEEAEIRKLNSITSYAQIRELLEKHRTACAVLEKNAIRLCPETEYRQKVYDILNTMMPTQISRLPSDII